MPPKRKAGPAVGGPKGSKRVASGVGTPVSIASSDDYVEDGATPVDDEEEEEIDHLVQKFSVGSYSRQRKEGNTRDPASAFFANRDFAYLPLKPDHANRPIWIDPNKGKMILESFSPMFKAAEEFMIDIAEPQSRVSRIHEYTLTPHSLFAAISVGLTTEDVLKRLEFFSKTPVPDGIRDFVIASTKSFGKVRLVLKHTKYYIESSDPAVLQKLLKDPIIGPCRVEDGEEITMEKAPQRGGLYIPGTKIAAGAKQATDQTQPQRQNEEDQEQPVVQSDAYLAELREDDDEDEETDVVHSFQVRADTVQTVQKRCRDIDLPLTEEYDFRNDEVNANLDIDLKPIVSIRHYQETALGKMFGNGRARSGIIVLPCGAGKTLVGITAACTIKKGVIVLCTSSMSVVQWRGEFLKWSNVNPNDVATFTADHKNMFTGNTGVIISTYSMVTQSRGRSYDSQKVMDFITSREWGLMILDEVHVVPADMFKKVTYAVAAHSKLGLTATLLREDDKIEDLNFLIGPKLYEANWQELSEQGHIARVQCAEVWCPMTTEFYTEYLNSTRTNQRSLLFTMNPRKFQACQYLIDFHESRGDKIIVFSDNVFALQRYAVKLKKPFIYGATGTAERLQILENFSHNENVSTIFLSKIGDTSLDLPEATCLIQISSHYGSRRQEAQRLGRILRAKRRNDEGFNAFFYSLVSKDTNEMYYSSKRQAFLVDQGYAFKVITHLAGMEKMPDLAFTTPQERRELLADVLLQSEEVGGVEKIDGDLFSIDGAGRKRKGGKKGGVRRAAGLLGDLSGAGDMAYKEFNTSKNKDLKGQRNTVHTAFMRKLGRDVSKRKAAAKELPQ
ncbi:DNA repair helicase rad25 [Patellaria atrata CBS 101060]|uniref:DNA 3'-5' helicase n=1 Tax=Patellaria atrata CBS 101060 TaxID=1346257 RepID=A0A9P4SFI5_9PEZI|nr:DNA repair helicase rad25 [Patellaria atrata CBS 101060]